MNTNQIQFNRQWVAALLFAGLTLAATLAWTGADASGSTVQPTNMGQSWPQLRAVKGSKIGTVMDGRTDFLGCESGLSSEVHLRAVKGSKLGTVMDGRTDFLGCESGLSSEVHLRSIKAGKMGGVTGGID